jgi:hypothetical protein
MICPGRGGDCTNDACCTRCRYILVPLIGALHFVRINDPERFERSVRHFGEPDIVHRTWDFRALAEIGPDDVAIFGRGSIDDRPSIHSWDDSAEPEDPATKERQ